MKLRLSGADSLLATDQGFSFHVHDIHYIPFKSSLENQTINKQQTIAVRRTAKKKK
jgi:hypothetical protein